MHLSQLWRALDGFYSTCPKEGSVFWKKHETRDANTVTGESGAQFSIGVWYLGDNCIQSVLEYTRGGEGMQRGFSSEFNGMRSEPAGYGLATT